MRLLEQGSAHKKSWMGLAVMYWGGFLAAKDNDRDCNSDQGKDETIGIKAHWELAWLPPYLGGKIRKPTEEKRRETKEWREHK